MTRLLRALSRLFRRLLPRPTPTPSDAPPSSQGAANGQPAPAAILDNACAVPKGYGYAWVDPNHLVAEWQETTTPTYGWVVGPVVVDSKTYLHVSQIPWTGMDLADPGTGASCYVEVAKPTELDAIAARFDAAVDAAAKGRSVPPPA